jgi:hypothetical protein
MKTRRKLIALSTLALLVTLMVPGLATAGHYYESTSTMGGQGKRGSDQQVVKAWVEGDSARVEFHSGDKKGMFADGNYLVTTDGGENVYMVMPKDETYGSFSLDEMMATLGSAMNMLENMGGMVKMEFTDVSSEKLSEEPGPSIHGHSTTHSRFKSGYTMNMAMMGMKQSNKVEMIQDIWSTTALDAPGFGLWLRPDRGMKTGNEGLDGLMNQEFSKIQGFPLKMVMESKTTNKKGKTQTSTTTSEVTVLREESIAGDKFEWPSHYTETEIIPDIEAMQAGNQKRGKKKKGGA